jgi:hypothetical protein
VSDRYLLKMSSEQKAWGRCGSRPGDAANVVIVIAVGDDAAEYGAETRGCGSDGDVAGWQM